MIVEPNYNASVYPLEKNIMSYPNIMTPPSSNEDSPQPMYSLSSPTSSNSYQGSEGYVPPQIFAVDILPHNGMIVDPLQLIDAKPGASLHFIEQPTDRFRFRYKSEMAGTHGSLTGANSDKSRKQTYPTVELRNCPGTAIVRCSIYQSNFVGKDFMPHAHRLIMKKGKEEHDDPHDIVVGPEDGWRAVFHGMGIIHTAKKNIVGELLRKKMQLMKEYVARTETRPRELTTKEQVEIKRLAEQESKSINLNIVCLRFDAFTNQNGILFPICEPIYSHGINNLKSALTGDLKIVRLDHCVSEAKGNKEIFILVERVTKKNIKIRFFQTDDDDRVIWEDYGKFNDLDVHHQYAIVFKTPKYRDENITQAVNVFIELVRPSDNARSEPRDFRYIPNKHHAKAGQKRARYEYSSSSYNSSNMGSDELPSVIDNLKIEANNNPDPFNNSLKNVPSGLSEEIVKALNNIHSDEFNWIYTENRHEYLSLELDGHRPYSNKIPHEMKFVDVDRQQKRLPSLITYGKNTAPAIKLEVTTEEKQMCHQVIDELKSFVRTKHKPQKGITMLDHFLGDDKKTNALHVAISINNAEGVEFLLKMIAVYRQFHLINKENSENYTPLQLAVLCHNETTVRSLLRCRARITSTDSNLNTALHHAVKSNAPLAILEMLLTDREGERIVDFIDMTNIGGDTALVLAIETKNIVAVKLLCMKNAGVNNAHDKNGFVPLRFAIEKQYLDIIKYLLSLPHLDATIKDFRNVSPLAAARQKESSKEITEVIQQYIIDHKIEDIKEEIEDDSDEEMDEEIDIKPDIVSSEDMKQLYTKVNNFTPQCLDEVSAILDSSRNWKLLAELLEVDHMISSGIIHSDRSMSKALLTYAVETNNDSVWMIRHFLESLGELRAVEIMDRMVTESKND